MHLLALIGDILDISKIESGEMTLQLQSFDIAALVEEVKNTIQPLLQKNNNELQVHCDHPLGTMVADRTKVKQVLLNLLNNATKFTHEGLITFKVTRSPTANHAAAEFKDEHHVDRDASDFVIFSVTDTGIGISEEQMKNVFEPFIQADNSSTRQYEGIGLGLSISQGFCQMMAGNLSLESQVEIGSTFTFTLPSVVPDPKPAIADS